jgi:hypothetical protein
LNLIADGAWRSVLRTTEAAALRSPNLHVFYYTRTRTAFCFNVYPSFRLNDRARFLVFYCHPLLSHMFGFLFHPFTSSSIYGMIFIHFILLLADYHFQPTRRSTC